MNLSAILKIRNACNLTCLNNFRVICEWIMGQAWKKLIAFYLIKQLFSSIWQNWLPQMHLFSLKQRTGQTKMHSLLLFEWIKRHSKTLYEFLYIFLSNTWPYITKIDAKTPNIDQFWIFFQFFTPNNISHKMNWCVKA